MPVVEDGRRERGRTGLAAVRVAVCSLTCFPAEVQAAGLRRRVETDLLVRALADVADVEVAGRPVEAPPPRVAQAQIPDFGLGARRPDKRVAGRDRVGAAGADLDAQDLAQEGVQALAGVERVAAAPAVAQPHIEIAVGTEGDEAAVVVGERLVAHEDALFAGRVGAVRIRRHPKAGDHGVVAFCVPVVIRRRRHKGPIPVVVGDEEVAR